MCAQYRTMLDARWMDVIPAPSLKLRYAVLLVCDIHVCYFFSRLCVHAFSLFFAVSRFLVVLLFIEMHTHKEVDKGT